LRTGDQRSAAIARLVAAAVDAELVLHRASTAVGQPVVAKRRPLPGEAVLESGTDPAVQPSQLVAVETGRGTQRIEPRAPQRLVDVDVPHPREGALIEERPLERRSAARETLAEPCGREERVERLVADAGGQVRLGLPGLEQKPGAEAPHVSVCDVRAVV
jgi:hypothetical protein